MVNNHESVSVIFYNVFHLAGADCLFSEYQKHGEDSFLGIKLLA